LVSCRIVHATKNLFHIFRPLSQRKLISKLILKFMQISSFRKKISKLSVNSQVMKEINFENIFHNL